MSPRVSAYRPKLSRMDAAVVRLVYAQQHGLLGPLVRVWLWLHGVEIPRQVAIGSGLVLAHPTAGIVIHPRTVLGDDVTLFHNVTIGRANPWEPEPAGVRSRVVIEDGAIIAAGAVLLFRPGRDLVIGAGAVVGANAVVTRDVPANTVLRGGTPAG